MLSLMCLTKYSRINYIIKIAQQIRAIRIIFFQSIFFIMKPKMILPAVIFKAKKLAINTLVDAER
ncbi:hypothetical protein DR85_1782 [Francisella tularensis]|nr:hypothetical protein DR85_1782 [Francisella tularensis]